jgi:hypothetical protein
MTFTQGAETNRIKVVFLTFYFEAWDALADIHAQMLADPRFEVTVISTQRRFTREAAFAEEDQVSEFFDEHGIEHLRFNQRDSFKDLETLRALAPDYVFINYPWQRNYPPGLRAELLSEFTKICYVPYFSLQLVSEPDVSGVAPHIYEQRSHQLASLIFTQDAAVVEAYGHTSRGNSHVHLTGTPKLDAQIRQANDGTKRWPLNNRGNQRMIWAPHHSHSPSWLNFGLFSEIFESMLEFAKSNRNLDIVMRPHPLMFKMLVDREVIAESILEYWLVAWNSLPNTAIDADGDVAHLFAAADLLLTDGISFLGEYPLATKKPGIFIEKPGHWKFSPLGEVSAAANIRVNNFAEFVMTFESIERSGMPNFDKQIETLRQASIPYPGESAKRIIQTVVADHEAKTPLVDKASITEIAWENRPGAEPAWD